MTTSTTSTLAPRRGWLPFGRRRDFGTMRAHQRHPCCIIARLGLPDRGVELDGLVLEISAGGLLFREASTFVYDRRGALVRVSFDGLDLAGTIVNAHSGGYGVKLLQPLCEDDLDSALARSDDLAPLSPA